MFFTFCFFISLFGSASDPSHTLALAFVMLFLCCIPYKIIVNLKALEKVLRTNMFAVYVFCILSLASYLFEVFLGFDVLHDIRLKATTANISLNVQRLYGLSSQPSQAAYYLLAFGPLALYQHGLYVGKGRSNYTMFGLGFGLLWICFILTFSVGGYVSFLVGGISVILFTKSWKKFFVVFPIFGVSLIALYLFNQEIFDNLLGKLLLDEGFRSVRQRVESIENALEFAVLQPFGLGLGGWSQLSGGSAINFYITFLLEISILGLLIFFVFVSFASFHLFYGTRSKCNTCGGTVVMRSIYNRVLMFSLITTLFSLNFHHGFGTSPIWLLLAFAAAAKNGDKNFAEGTLTNDGYSNEK